MMKCTCGGNLERRDGLEGFFCEKCDMWYSDDAVGVSEDTKAFSDDRVRSLRGVPHNTFTIGTESKGRVCVQVPANATHDERNALIKENLESLQYMIETAKKMGLNIFTGR